jgi:thermitase
MQTIIIGLFVLVASIFLTTNKYRTYSYAIGGFLSVLFLIIIGSLFSAEMTVMEKAGWTVVTILEILAVPLLLYFLVEEKSVPKTIALIIGTGLVMFAQELRERELKDYDLLFRIEQVATNNIFTLKLGTASVQKAFDPLFDTSTDLDDYYSVSFKDISEAKFEKYYEYLSEKSWIFDLETDEHIFLVKPIVSDPITIAPTPIDVSLNDPLLSKQWGMNAVNLPEAFLHLEKMQFKAKRKSKVVVLDTGLKGDHEDLRSNVFTIDKESLTDKNGHGTHCAGTISAVNNNGKGISSFNFGNSSIEVSGIKVLSNQGIGSESRIVNGIVEAVDAGADVISMSLGGIGNPLKQKAYRKAIEYAKSRNVIIVSAAGNSAANAKRYLPTSMDYVFSVSALEPDLTMAKFSNTVKDVTKGIAAPGVKVLSTDETGSYKMANGTSMAAPFVSGLIALMRSIDQDLNAEEVYNILHQSGLELNSNLDSGRLIQADKAILITLNQLDQ